LSSYISSVIVDCEAKDSRERRSGRSSESGPKTSSASWSSIEILVSYCSPFESRETGLPPAKSGAGGNGLLGLPYLVEGVPGRGVPFMVSGSKETLDAAGLGQSLDPRDGVQGRGAWLRVGEPGL
jgi:hypothetical protein